MPSKIEWTQGQLSMVGEMPDLRLARLMGVSTMTVKRKREALKIPRCKGIWNHKNRALLGTMSDSALAKRLRITQQRVSQVRNQEGIKPFRDRKK